MDLLRFIRLSFLVRATRLFAAAMLCSFAATDLVAQTVYRELP
jgi:hypothetical protein